jgi:hypothetical protein
VSKLNKQLIKDCKTPEGFFSENGLIKSFVKHVDGRMVTINAFNRIKFRIVFN